jgi:hypothetical protein
MYPPPPSAGPIGRASAAATIQQKRHPARATRSRTRSAAALGAAPHAGGPGAGAAGAREEGGAAYRRNLLRTMSAIAKPIRRRSVVQPKRSPDATTHVNLIPPPRCRPARCGRERRWRTRRRAERLHACQRRDRARRRRTRPVSSRFRQSPPHPSAAPPPLWRSAEEQMGATLAQARRTERVQPSEVPNYRRRNLSLGHSASSHSEDQFQRQLEDSRI